MCLQLAYAVLYCTSRWGLLRYMWCACGQVDLQRGGGVRVVVCARAGGVQESEGETCHLRRLAFSHDNTRCDGGSIPLPLPHSEIVVWCAATRVHSAPLLNGRTVRQTPGPLAQKRFGA